MVKQLEDHPEDFPDLRKEDIADSISKGTAAFENMHTSAEGVGRRATRGEHRGTGDHLQQYG